MKTNIYIIILSILVSGCSKDFLNEKPDSSIVVPKTLSELQALLENHSVMNVTGGLGQISSDDALLSNDADYFALKDETSRNAYIWNKDVYNGQTGILDWNSLYKCIFYANNVLAELGQNKYTDQVAMDNIKGSALFFRAFAFFDLTQHFAPAYNSSSAPADLGIPLRLDPGIDYVQERSSVKETYAQILSDLNEASVLLKAPLDNQHPNRPSKPAAFAMLARVYLNMGRYDLAEENAEKGLALYNKLIDFNTLSTSSVTPITYVNDECLFFATQVSAYTDLTGTSATARPYNINPELRATYTSSDLRPTIFFVKTPAGNYNSKRRYTGSNTPFSGLTTAELYLIKAECLARRGDLDDAMFSLNTLLESRFKTGMFMGLSASTKEEALDKILLERRKELVFRCQRWPDLRRLNREGHGIELKRILDGKTYALPAGDTRYTFPIPDDEISMSGIEQNER